MNRFEDEIARELLRSTDADKRTARVLARWAAAEVPVGGLTADAVALVRARLADGDAGTLAEAVVRERPDRFGPNWRSGPAH